MNKLMINGFLASINCNVGSQETCLIGEIYPFPQTFFSIRFSLTIKKEKNSFNIYHDVGFSGNSFTGVMAGSYIKAAQSALDYVQGLEVISRGLMDGSDAAELMAKLAESKDYETLQQYALLVPSPTLTISPRANWNFRRTEKSDCVLDALFKDSSFKSLIEAAIETSKAVTDEDFANLSEDNKQLTRITCDLVDRAGFLGFQKKDYYRQVAKAVLLINKGESALTFKYDQLDEQFPDSLESLIVDFHSMTEKEST